MPQPRPFVAGATIPVEGADLLIVHDVQAARLPVVAGDRLVVGGPADMVERRVVAWLKRRALAVLEEETALYAGRAGVAVARVGMACTLPDSRSTMTMSWSKPAAVTGRRSSRPPTSRPVALAAATGEASRAALRGRP
jgi:hypothetical protein